MWVRGGERGGVGIEVGEVGGGGGAEPNESGDGGVGDECNSPEDTKDWEVFGVSSDGGTELERGKGRESGEEVIKNEGSFIDGEGSGARLRGKRGKADEWDERSGSLGAIVGGAREEEEREVATECGDEQLGKVVKSKGSEEEVSR